MAANKYDMTHIDTMDGHDFEYFIAALLRKLGYLNVDVTRGSGDQGVDVLAEKEGVRYAVQCKCYSSDLGNTPVQEVNTGKAIYNCHVGVVVTNRYFTRSAKEAAKATGVLLWDRAKLQDLITQAEVMSQSVSNENALLKRGFMALEDGEWHKANKVFEQVLNLNAECSEAYLGKVLAATQAASLEELRGKMVQLDTFKDFSRAMQFASGTQLQDLQAVNEFMQKKWQAKEEAEHCRREEEARVAEEQKEAWIAKVSPFWKPLREHNLIAAGLLHNVGLKADGTVIIAGSEYETPDWKDIVAVAIDETPGLTVGLKADGTVVRVYREGRISSPPDRLDAQKDVSGWTNIMAVAAGSSYTLGLRYDGTVVAVGWNFEGQCDAVSNWKDIVMVAAGWQYIVGLKSDGSVVATGHFPGRKDVLVWRNIVAVDADLFCTVGLKSDGTVVAAGENEYGQCNVSGWKNIVSVATGGFFTVGLRSDGTVVAVGCNDSGQCNVSGWKNIIAIAAGDSHTVGLKNDGTVVAVGNNNLDQCNVSEWKLFNSIETLEQERIYAKAEAEEQRWQSEERQQQKAEEKQLRAILEQERSSLQTERDNLRGLFTGRRRRKIEARLKEIERKLGDLYQ